MSREERWERRLALPVLIAALASIPAMFLTFAGGTLGTAGRAVDVLSGLVLVAESVVLLWVAEDKRAWIRGHRGMLLLTGGVLLAIVLAVGPVQVLRLIRTVGALRVLRAGRIVRAARVLAARIGLAGRGAHLFAGIAGTLVAVFVGVVLADPTSQSRSLLTAVVGPISTPVVVVLSVLAGALLGGATYLLARDSGEGDEDGAGAGEGARPAAAG
ncbi:hypothetical protein JD78_02098 [Modestobacter roseus]|uniref:Uncharacterized protein n=2 Tax=Modestobacter roseus TaxID=1181884 RepID=A0A562ISP2_9ACTN|nr:hypothetical protein [Modestobacter roseus]TWH73574.1 hypothetical protein JD78_02098 [Modestobacter roseus]